MTAQGIHISKAMVLAAGRGERLRPLTDTLPKPLVDIGRRSMLDRQLDMMAAAGVTQAVVNCSWLAEQIQQRMDARNAHGEQPFIYLSHEQERLETGGGIVRALPMLGDAPFFVSNADVVVVDAPHSSALERLKAAWDDATMDALL
jgi:MurNAc alpha-1-phosphate uridylyltransferase